MNFNRWLCAPIPTSQFSSSLPSNLGILRGIVKPVHLSVSVSLTSASVSPQRQSHLSVSLTSAPVSPQRQSHLSVSLTSASVSPQGQSHLSVSLTSASVSPQRQSHLSVSLTSASVSPQRQSHLSVSLSVSVSLTSVSASVSIIELQKKVGGIHSNKPCQKLQAHKRALSSVDGSMSSVEGFRPL